MTAMVLLNNAGAEADYTVRAGTDWYDDFQLLDSTDTPIDITGYTITANISESSAAGAAVLKTFTVTVTSAALGKFRIKCAAAIATLTPATYVWQMQWNDGTNDVPAAFGNFVVLAWGL
jgi:hypothetical protein